MNRKAACVIGWPVEHSRSPLIHEYWIRQLGLEAEYRREAVPPDRFADFIARLADHGPNVLARDQRPGLGSLLWHAILNPLVLLLGILAAVSLATGDARSATMMAPPVSVQATVVPVADTAPKR